MSTEPLLFTYLSTAIGELLLAGTSSALRYVSFPTGHKAFRPQAGWRRDDGALPEVRRQLTAYFGGELAVFDLPLQLGGTDFQRKVWQMLASIPYGETRSYGWLATAVGSPSSARAVGAANGANPIPIILPCHRVIGSTGALTGFGGGIETKRFLLELEGVRVKKGAADRQLSLL
jgi:methylated-DNA-[protein]-cysteine S-methyltransferase